MKSKYIKLLEVGFLFVLFYSFLFYLAEEQNIPNSTHFSEECGLGPRFIINFFGSICTILM